MDECEKYSIYRTTEDVNRKRKIFNEGLLKQY